MKVCFVRHGEIPSNVLKVYSGRSQEALNENGVLQAHAVGEKFSARSIEAIYSSPLCSTMQTAEIIASYTLAPIIEQNCFIEMQMGPWEGKSEQEIEETYPDKWKLWNTMPAELSLAGRETLNELQDRVIDGLQCINSKKHESGVIIVTHVAVIRVAMLYAAGVSLNQYKTVHVPNGQVFEMELNLP